MGTTYFYSRNNVESESKISLSTLGHCGTSTIKPRRFIAKAIKKLKGLDDRAAQRFMDKAAGEIDN